MIVAGESGTVKARPAVPELLDELFSAVQEAQGHGFISDGEAYGLTHQQFFDQIRSRLDWNKEAIKIIKKFLRKYGERA
jgi:hypothetical protein